ncbi:hypothetical protein DL98DRAFT_593343 [Cadophora sp. DSE1049]|nr:hypothetical protein DL98DRAFT_593343 [Cadophora sp. DSE1049]
MIFPRNTVQAGVGIAIAILVVSFLWGLHALLRFCGSREGKTWRHKQPVRWRDFREQEKEKNSRRWVVCKEALVAVGAWLWRFLLKHWNAIIQSILLIIYWATTGALGGFSFPGALQSPPTRQIRKFLAK